MGVNAADLQTALKIVTSEKPVISLVHPQGFKLDKKKLVGLYKRPKVNLVAKDDTGISREKEAGITFITKRSSELPVRSLRLIFLGGGSREERKRRILGSPISFNRFGHRAPNPTARSIWPTPWNP
ncbi:MAG: hypothetical protein R3B54_16375 [Bdellovibrionota bacterium]